MVTQSTSLLQVLDKALDLLPDLLSEPLDTWRTERIDSLPTLDRLVRTIVIDDEQFDLFLHRGYMKKGTIEPHTHPCRAAMCVVYGSYELMLGYGKERFNPVSKILLRKGCRYEMTEPYTWHYFKPLSDFTLSIMVAGRLYEEKQVGQPGMTSVELPKKSAQEVLDLFAQMFCGECA